MHVLRSGAQYDEMSPLLCGSVGPEDICLLYTSILACSLLCACRAYEEYQKKGISDTVYFETMKCFTRFIDETQKRTGRLAFDRGWWTYRQISMQLFRIGELEYEFVEYEGRPALSIHIPSDAHFSKELVDVYKRQMEYVTFYSRESEDNP